MSLVEQYIKEYREKLSYPTQIKVSQLDVIFEDGSDNTQIVLLQPHYLAVWENVMWIPTNDSETLNQVDIYVNYGVDPPIYQLYRQLGTGLPNNYHYAVSYTELILQNQAITFIRQSTDGTGRLYIPAFKIVPYPSL